MSYGEPLSSFSELYGRDSVDLLARMIYSEARGESWSGKQGVAFVAANRKAKNSPDFGGGTYEGVILSGQFEGMTTTSALQPDTNSVAWADSLYIADNMATQNNPIGNCLWFVGNSYYSTHSRYNNGYEQYTFGGPYINVIEKVVIGNHTFFRIAGY